MLFLPHRAQKLGCFGLRNFPKNELVKEGQGVIKSSGSFKRLSENDEHRALELILKRCSMGCGHVSSLQEAVQSGINTSS